MLILCIFDKSVATMFYIVNDDGLWRNYSFVVMGSLHFLILLYNQITKTMIKHSTPTKIIKSSKLIFLTKAYIIIEMNTTSIINDTNNL